MMDGARKSCTERILNAIEYGRLPNDETERRLSALVEAEVIKTDSAADMELIDACQSLLWQLYTHGEVPYESHCDQNWTQITRRLNREVEVARTAKFFGRMLVVAAAVVFVVLGLKGGLEWSWLEHDNTPDQQQHIIMGNEMGVELIQSAVAEFCESGQIRISSSAELAEHIGFVPIPLTLNKAWEFSFADITADPIRLYVDAHYVHNVHQSKVAYTTILFTNVEEAYYMFEQSANGDSLDVAGHQVYVSSNMHRTTMCWTDGLVVVQISGEFPIEEGLLLIEDLLKEWYKR